jgi:hypothetical protein
MESIGQGNNKWGMLVLIAKITELLMLNYKRIDVYPDAD